MSWIDDLLNLNFVDQYEYVSGNNQDGDGYSQHLPDLNIEGYGHGQQLPDLNQEVVLSNEVTQDFNEYYNLQQSYPECAYGSQHSFSYHNHEQAVDSQSLSVPREPVNPVVVQADDNENFPSVSFKTDQKFSSCEDLIKWVKDFGKAHGYVINISRSKSSKIPESKDVRKVWLQCDRGGQHSSKATIRRAGSRKIGCPFKLTGDRDYKSRLWTLTEVNKSHNHQPAKFLEGHPYARRLDPEEIKTVEKMDGQTVDARNILGTVKGDRKCNVSVRKDVHNALQKIRREKNVGETPMQKLLHLLFSGDYMYNTRIDPNTNVVEDIFFVHPVSYKIWQEFPHVLLIDATYTTNQYQMPVVEFAGVTSTGLSFVIATAIVSNERQETYLWVLQMLKGMMEKNMEPRSIVTDREVALMNACRQTFPNATKSLCRFHIENNIWKNCKRVFNSKEEWHQFLRLWRTLCKSPMEEEYLTARENMRDVYNEESRFHPLVKYIFDNWLNEHHTMFVACWCNQKLNFGEHTTNRAESQHATLKAYLKTRNSSLHQIVVYLDRIVHSQETEIRKSFEDSRIRKMNHHRIPLFDNLLGRVSHKALNKLLDELPKIEYFEEHNMECRHSLFTSCGLPCACRLQGYLNTFDLFWRRLTFEPNVYVDDEPVFEDDAPPPDVDRTFQEYKEYVKSKPLYVQKHFLSKVKSLFFPSTSDLKPPLIQKTRGRPKISKQAKPKDDPPRRSWSSVEPAIQPARHSSYIPSQNPDTSIQTPVNHGFSLLHSPEMLDIINRFGHFIPEIYRPYIAHIQDVEGDGNCGFRALAVGMGMSEHEWRKIRATCLKEIDEVSEDNANWSIIFNSHWEDSYQETRDRLNWFGEGLAPYNKWMELPQHGLVFAEAYHMCVHSLSINGSQTYLPMTYGPSQNHVKPHVIPLVHVYNNHYIHVKLVGEYPAPPTETIWNKNRTEDALEWRSFFTPQIRRYIDIMGIGGTEYRDFIEIPD